MGNGKWEMGNGEWEWEWEWEMEMEMEMGRGQRGVCLFFLSLHTWEASL